MLTGTRISFVAGSLDHIHVFLLFGTDAGLISERTNAILRRCGTEPLKLGPGHAVRRRRPRGKSRTAIRRIAWDRAVCREYAPSWCVREAVRSLLRSRPHLVACADCKIIIQAGQLRRDAPLRKLFERQGHAASIECYPDQIRDIERLVDQSMKEAGLQIEPAARAALIVCWATTGLSTRGEIEKLVLLRARPQTGYEADVIEAVCRCLCFATDQFIYASLFR